MIHIERRVKRRGPVTLSDCVGKSLKLMEPLAHKTKLYMFVYLFIQLFIYVYYMQLLLTQGDFSEPEKRQTRTSIMKGGGVSQDVKHHLC